MSQPPGYPQGPPGPFNQGPGWVAGAGPPAGGPAGPGYGYPPPGGQQPAGSGHGRPAGSSAPPVGDRSDGEPGTALIVTLQLAAPLLILLGLTLPENDTVGWSSYLAWAIFALAVSLIPLVAMPLARSTGAAHRTWPIIVLATAGLVAYWVIVVLPGVTSNTGFLQTAGVGCGASATWLLSQRHARG